MYKDKKNLFGRGYFEEGRGLQEKRIYNWDNTSLGFKVITNSIRDTIRPDTVLDIGCAKGYLVYLLSESGINAYGVDVSSYAISQAPEKIKGKLYNLDIEKEIFPFPDIFFELVTVLEVLEHLNSFEHLMIEIKRILKKDGYVLVTTPTPGGILAKKDETHINVQSKKFWVKLFNHYGLSLVNDGKWICFRAAFLKELRKVMPERTPSTKISAFFKKMGGIGNIIRNNIFPYIYYFSPLRPDEIMLFINNK